MKPKEQKQKEAKERQEAYDKLTDEQKLKKNKDWQEKHKSEPSYSKGAQVGKKNEKKAEEKSANSKRPKSKGWNIRRQLSPYRNSAMGIFSSVSRAFARTAEKQVNAPVIHGIIWRQ